MSVLWQKRTHGVQRRKDTQNQTLAWAALAVIVVVTLLAAAYLSLAAANVRLGARVWQMEEDLITQQRTNQKLMVEISHWSSISVLQRRAVELGYIPAESVYFLETEAP